MNLNDILKNMDERKLQEGIKKAQEFLSTNEGKQFASQLSQGDLNKVASSLQDNPQNLSVGDRDKIIKEISKNPEIIKKIEKLFKK